MDCKKLDMVVGTGVWVLAQAPVSLTTVSCAFCVNPAMS